MIYLPKNTEIGKVIPKNAFYSGLNTKQKQLFTEKILRITWTHSLSSQTINLSSEDIEEIQFFEIELKGKSFVKEILEVIQRSIPYHIVCIVLYGREFYLSIAAKHKNPNNPDNAVIDYMFETTWGKLENFSLNVLLKNNLDWVFMHICNQLKGTSGDLEDIKTLVNSQRERDRLERQIKKLKSKIAGERQFNRKVEMNIKMNKLEEKLRITTSRLFNKNNSTEK